MDWRNSSLANQKGQVLLVLIAGFVIAAGVGLGMVYLSGTSSYSELLTNNAVKAEALAEAGIRVAVPWASRDKENALANLNGKTFALEDGTFAVVVDDTPTDHIAIQSTGVVNTGTFLETRRLITYRLPKGGGSAAPTYENQDWTDDAMDINSNRQDGAFEIATVGGDSALHVTDVATGSYKQDAVAGFAPASDSSPEFQDIWRTGGNLLSYRAQVKIYDNPSDNYYMAGISFRVGRLDQLTGSLGVSLFRSYRGGQGTYAIPDSLVPQWWCPLPPLCLYLDYAAILLLWTQTNEGSGGRVPLAYHILDLNWFFYSSNDLYVVDASDHLLPWVTLLVSVEEKQIETQRVNDIKVYVGNVQTDHGANDTPLDPSDSAVRLKHERGQINWPPVDVNQTTTTNDLFTLVQWTAVDNRVQVLGSGKEENGVVRTNLATTSPDSYVDRPEIALVAFGTRTNARHIYFDDFAVDFPFGGSGSSSFVQY
jgi:hypothetical protein